MYIFRSSQFVFSDFSLSKNCDERSAKEGPSLSQNRDERSAKGGLSLSQNRDERSAKGGPLWWKTVMNGVPRGALCDGKPWRTECQGGPSLKENRDERRSQTGF